MTLSELGDMLRGNFEGAERMRQYLINRCPKIGNGIEEADRIGVEMYDMIREELTHYTTSVGATFHPSYFAWIMHGRLGMVAAATPDGRKQGEALSECLGSVQGMDRNGPTGILRSIEKIDQKYGIGGIATNLRFTKTLMDSPEGREAVKDYIKTFMAHDCFEVQFNVVDQKDLIEAKEHPEKHRTLMVRVAGYSDYFVNLDQFHQEEIIARTAQAGV
jgi:formate C-acetyltransferase